MRPRAGAGLGGGSANAATALWAANALAGRPASEAQLLDWAGAIGSDISVFFSHGAAYCTGRWAGEREHIVNHTRLWSAEGLWGRAPCGTGHYTEEAQREASGTGATNGSCTMCAVEFLAMHWPAGAGHAIRPSLCCFHKNIMWC